MKPPPTQAAVDAAVQRNMAQPTFRRMTARQIAFASGYPHQMVREAADRLFPDHAERGRELSRPTGVRRVR